jgi:hypothetical protein
MTEKRKTLFVQVSLMAAVALAACVALGAGSALAKLAPDGAWQNSSGGWDYDTGSCSLFPAETTRPDCGSEILSRAGATNASYDTESKCTAAGFQWTAGPTCTNQWFIGHYPYDDPDYCEDPGAHYDADYVTEHADKGNPGIWDTDICRGKWVTLGTYGEDRDGCLHCHNDQYYAAYPERQKQDYLLTGHKNMSRPIADIASPWGGLPPTFTSTYGWAGSDGTFYGPNPPWDWPNGDYIVCSTTGEACEEAADCAPNACSISNDACDDASDCPATETCVAVVQTCDQANQALWIYAGWIGSTPRMHHEGSGTYSCGRCHTTGWESAKVLTKEPWLTFGATLPGSANALGSWDQWGIQCSRCHGSEVPETRSNHHPNFPGKEATSNRGEPPATGATITNLCMDCHRQETGGQPYGPDTFCDDATTPCADNTDCLPAGACTDGGTGGSGEDCWADTDCVTGETCDDFPTCSVIPTELKVGNAHGHLGFLSHWHGNHYLNSPHGRFESTFANINDEDLYDTHFPVGCTVCHDVHKSTVEAANPDGGAIREECTDCHSKSLSTLIHPGGPGTPLEDVGSDPAAPCVSCHMPEGFHLVRINVDEDYVTIPEEAFTMGPMDAPTVPDDGFEGAVWVDVDHACGQCHGGGEEQDDHHQPSNGAGYMTKAELAEAAEGIHNDQAYATFGYGIGNPNTLEVTFSAMGTYCYGPCNYYNWDFGDGETGPPWGVSGLTITHEYAAAGTYEVTLTAGKYGAQPGTATKYVTVYAPDTGPTTGGLDCETVLSETNWEASFTDASQDPGGAVAIVTVDWGDGSLKASGAPGMLFEHTYRGAGPRVITHKAYDTLGQEDATTCTVNPTYFTIAGSVLGNACSDSKAVCSDDTDCAAGICTGGGEESCHADGDCPATETCTDPEPCDLDTGLRSARVTVKDSGGVVVKMVYSAVDGSYSAGSLKPGDYTLTTTKLGYTFPDVGPVTVGPSSAGDDITATAP